MQIPLAEPSYKTACQTQIHLPQHGISPRNQSLDELELGGGNVQSIDISRQAGVALLLAGGSKGEGQQMLIWDQHRLRRTG